MSHHSAAVELAIIASVFGRLCAAINLRKRGIENFVILERRGFMGGTWFQNRYPRAYLGTTVPDFPNLFIVTGLNTGIGHTSALFIIESQMLYIMGCIERVKRGGAGSIEVRVDAEASYTRHIHSEMERTVWKSGGCNSWYQSKSGHVIAMFPGFSFTYRRWTRNFRAEDHSIA